MRGAPCRQRLGESAVWRRVRKAQILGAGLFLISAAVAVGQSGNPNSIVYSKHNLSANGPGTIHANTVTEVCVFCHTPHFATGDGPLWNHTMSSAFYTPYSSATLKATVGQPTGASRLCLSCHDGTVALGSLHNPASGIDMNVTTMPSGRSNLGTDLSADHPISFVYDHALAVADGNLLDPATLPQEVQLDHSGQ
ncbi:MAG TPA: hypothetical protein VF988_11995, partial [Verrucomicrobiae bacterium]